eukprot:13362290-Alexandrium_andersonii.AAC.1
MLPSRALPGARRRARKLPKVSAALPLRPPNQLNGGRYGRNSSIRVSRTSVARRRASTSLRARLRP